MSDKNNSTTTHSSSATEPVPLLLSGTNTASSADWPTMSNPTGWGKSADHLNVGKEGLVGHCWKALTVTTEYPSTQTISGIRTDSNQPFTIEHSMDGVVWTVVEGKFTGDHQDTTQPLEPFLCRYTRMSWANTVGTNGIHAQFVGVDAGNNAAPHPLCGSAERHDHAECAASPNLPCIDSAFSGACEALQERMSEHLARVDESEKEAEEQFRRKYDENRDDWRERLEAGVREFEQHYDEQMAELRETLRMKRLDHEARLIAIEEAFLTDHQASLDEAKQRMWDKMVDFEVDVLGGQV